MGKDKAIMLYRTAMALFREWITKDVISFDDIRILDGSVESRA